MGGRERIFPKSDRDHPHKSKKFKRFFSPPFFSSRGQGEARKETKYWQFFLLICVLSWLGHSDILENGKFHLTSYEPSRSAPFGIFGELITHHLPSGPTSTSNPLPSFLIPPHRRPASMGTSPRFSSASRRRGEKEKIPKCVWRS